MTKRNYLIVRVVVCFLLTFNFQLLTFNLLAQSGGVGINATGGAADNSAMLDISSTNQGMRIPRVALESTTSNAPIANPVNSLLVYDSVTAGDVTPGFYYWDGAASKWVRFSTGSGSGWSTSGNVGTDTATNFIGTTDDKSWVMKTNSTQRMKISKTGNVVIGATNPASSAILDVNSTTKGQLIPRMSSANRDAIVSPAVGLQIFNIDCNMNEYYTGSCWVSMGKSLPNPGPITGNTSLCAAATQTYSISTVTGANTYTWTVPPGAIINSGQGTTSINVTFGNTSGTVCVDASNNCESTNARCVSVNINPTGATPGPITGPTSVPRGTSVSYYIAAVAGATSYTWAVPTGASITSGVNTSTIVVSFPCSSSSGNVSVTTQSACGGSTASSVLVVTVGPIANAGPTVTGGATIGGPTSFPTASAGSVPYTYLWGPTTFLSSSTAANPVAQQCSGPTTTYTVTVSDANACTATSSVVVTRNITASAGSNVTGPSCGAAPTIGGSPTATNGKAPYTYSWSPSTGLSATNVSNPIAGPTTTTTYTVVIVDANGCGNVSSMVYTPSAPPSVTTTYTASYTGSIDSWTVPAGKTCILIDAYGAQGGTQSSYAGGKGAEMKGYFSVTPGQVLKILVGQQGFAGTSYFAGGGGGTFVTDNSNNPLIVAGGGGGGDGNWGNTGGAGVTSNDGTSSSCCAGGTAGTGGGATNGSAGGGGFTGDGTISTCGFFQGGSSFTHGGAGGPGYNNAGAGGFGGGSGCSRSCGEGAGAGGGYSGGAGRSGQSSSAGGGSYNGGAYQTNTGNVQSGNGQVKIVY